MITWILVVTLYSPLTHKPLFIRTEYDTFPRCMQAMKQFKVGKNEIVPAVLKCEMKYVK